MGKTKQPTRNVLAAPPNLLLLLLLLLLFLQDDQLIIIWTLDHLHYGRVLFICVQHVLYGQLRVPVSGIS